MAIAFEDTFTVGADVNIEAYPATPDYSLMNGSPGNIKVNAANDRVQCNVAATFIRVRCINAACPTGDQQVTLTGNVEYGAQWEQFAVMARCHPTTDDAYAARISADLTQGLYRLDSGSLVSLATGAAVLAGTHTVVLSVTGTGASIALSMQTDGGTAVIYDDVHANRKTSGTAGFYQYNDTANQSWVDDLSVDDLAVGGESSPGPMFRGS